MARGETGWPRLFQLNTALSGALVPRYYFSWMARIFTLRKATSP